MQDRQPASGKAGRVKITSEGGGAAYYVKVEMADGATVEGTPWAKASVLADSTAALFGLDNMAVPNDVLAILGKHLNGHGTYTGDGAATNTLTFDFVPRVIIIMASRASGAGSAFGIYFPAASYGWSVLRSGTDAQPYLWGYVASVATSTVDGVTTVTLSGASATMNDNGGEFYYLGIG